MLVLLHTRMAEEAGYNEVHGHGWVEDGWEPGVLSTFAPLSGTLGQRRGGFQKLVAQQVAHGGVEMMDHVTVTGVLLEPAVGGLSPLRAVGVEVGIVHGPTGIVTARQRLLVGRSGAQVVLCAGAIESPKLLLLSGIGDREELLSLGIACRVHSPQVGRNLQDHMIVPMVHICKTKAQRMQTAQTNPLGSHGFLHFSVTVPCSGGQGADAHSKHTKHTKDSKDSKDLVMRAQVLVMDASAADVVSPDCIAGCLGRHDTLLGQAMQAVLYTLLSTVMKVSVVKSLVQSSYSALLCLMSPVSHGRVTLASRNPLEGALIDPGYLSDQRDVDALLAASRVHDALAATPYGRGLFAMQLMPVHKWLKALACPYFHHVSTCRMVAKGHRTLETRNEGEGMHETAVVDDKLRVIGVEGLRVADASIAPHMPCAPTQAMSYMIGHHAAKLLLQDLIGHPT